MGWRNKYLVRVIVKNSGLSREEFCKATAEIKSIYDEAGFKPAGATIN